MVVFLLDEDPQQFTMSRAVSVLSFYNLEKSDAQVLHEGVVVLWKGFISPRWRQRPCVATDWKLVGWFIAYSESHICILFTFCI